MNPNVADLSSACGLYCGACPSFLKKTCFGCRSTDKSQKRISKWECKIRKCCIEVKNLEFCFSCDEYPCKILTKLKNTHLGNEKYNYRHTIFQNMVRISKIGLEEWLEEQKVIWACPNCAGRIMFYEYRCSDCGKEVVNVIKKYVTLDE